MLYYDPVLKYVKNKYFFKMLPHIIKVLVEICFLTCEASFPTAK